MKLRNQLVVCSLAALVAFASSCADKGKTGTPGQIVNQAGTAAKEETPPAGDTVSYPASLEGGWKVASVKCVDGSGVAHLQVMSAQNASDPIKSSAFPEDVSFDLEANQGTYTEYAFAEGCDKTLSFSHSFSTDSSELTLAIIAGRSTATDACGANDYERAPAVLATEANFAKYFGGSFSFRFEEAHTQANGKAILERNGFNCGAGLENTKLSIELVRGVAAGRPVADAAASNAPALDTSASESPTSAASSASSEENASATGTNLTDGAEAQASGNPSLESSVAEQMRQRRLAIEPGTPSAAGNQGDAGLQSPSLSPIHEGEGSASQSPVSGVRRVQVPAVPGTYRLEELDTETPRPSASLPASEGMSPRARYEGQIVDSSAPSNQPTVQPAQHTDNSGTIQNVISSAPGMTLNGQGALDRVDPSTVSDQPVIHPVQFENNSGSVQDVINSAPGLSFSGQGPAPVQGPVAPPRITSEFQVITTSSTGTTPRANQTAPIQTSGSDAASSEIQIGSPHAAPLSPVNQAAVSAQPGMTPRNAQTADVVASDSQPTSPVSTSPNAADRAVGESPAISSAPQGQEFAVTPAAGRVVSQRSEQLAGRAPTETVSAPAPLMIPETPRDSVIAAGTATPAPQVGQTPSGLDLLHGRVNTLLSPGGEHVRNDLETGRHYNQAGAMHEVFGTPVSSAPSPIVSADDSSQPNAGRGRTGRPHRARRGHRGSNQGFASQQ